MFPSPVELKEFLIDKLEPVEDIDEKYYLSESFVESCYRKNEYNEENGIGFRFSPVKRESLNIAKTLTTKEGQREYNNFVTERESIAKTLTTKEGARYESNYVLEKR